MRETVRVHRVCTGVCCCSALMTALGILNMREDNRNRDIESDSYMLDSAISDSDHGRFQLLPFAKRIAQTISARRDPSSIVIGIYGAWGGN